MEHGRVSQCWSELTAFTNGILESSHTYDLPVFTRQSDRPYHPSDSMTRYALIFDQFRKMPTATATVVK